MTSPSQLGTLRSLPLVQRTTSESGTQPLDRNFSELRFQDLSVSAVSSWQMVRALYLDGMTVKSEHSCLNQVNSSTWSMTLTTTVLLLSLSLMTAPESSPVVWKEKFESGRSELRLRSWKLPSRNIEEESLTSESTRMTIKQCLHPSMDHALFGTCRLTQG